MSWLHIIFTLVIQKKLMFFLGKLPLIPHIGTLRLIYQILYYDKTESGYVRQYEDIPTD